MRVTRRRCGETADYGWCRPRRIAARQPARWVVTCCFPVSRALMIHDLSPGVASTGSAPPDIGTWPLSKFGDRCHREVLSDNTRWASHGTPKAESASGLRCRSVGDGVNGRTGRADRSCWGNSGSCFLLDKSVRSRADRRRVLPRCHLHRNDHGWVRHRSVRLMLVGPAKGAVRGSVSTEQAEGSPCGRSDLRMLWPVDGSGRFCLGLRGVRPRSR